MAIASVVLAVIVLQASTIAVIGSSSGDSLSSIQRVETTRAFFAAESGLVVALVESASGVLPTQGLAVDLGGARFEMIAVPALNSTGDIVLEGRSGITRRRIRVGVE
ncbi:MAG: hypothetical protein AAF235_09150 [Planctomycetota bacterium]